MNEKPEKEQPDKVNLPKTVEAAHCLWFAWALQNFQGPHGEGEASRPVWFPIERGITHVTVKVVGGDEWQHGDRPIEKTNAHGRTDAEGTKSLRDQAYRTDYGASQVAVNPARLNCLMALAGNEAAPIFPFEAIPVGLEGTVEIQEPNTDGRRLYLGMHDAYQWNNNTGSMQVEVTPARKVEL
ncbi:MAG: hypothetical protein ACI9G1_000603 [Pirellulaceae bacterium]|jgi:hypothetical protein